MVISHEVSHTGVCELCVLAVAVLVIALVAIFSVKIEITADSFTKEELAPLFEKMPPAGAFCPRNVREEFRGVDI